MNPTSSIPRIRLRVTPRRLALEYLGEVLNFGDLSHLGARIKEMSRALQRHCGSDAARYYGLIESAYAEMSFLIELYMHMACCLLEEICLSWQLNTFVFACLRSENRDWPKIGQLLTSQHNRFSVLVAAIHLVEREYLGGTKMLPASIHCLVAEEQRACKQNLTFAGEIHRAQLVGPDGSVNPAEQFLIAAVPLARQLAGVGTMARCWGQFFRLYELMNAHRRTGSESIRLLRFNSNWDEPEFPTVRKGKRRKLVKK